jgi:hypothetical protein
MHNATTMKMTIDLRFMLIPLLDQERVIEVEE